MSRDVPCNVWLQLQCCRVESARWRGRRPPTRPYCRHDHALDLARIIIEKIAVVANRLQLVGGSFNLSQLHRDDLQHPA
jgi:hypothetical protein